MRQRLFSCPSQSVPCVTKAPNKMGVEFEVVELIDSEDVIDASLCFSDYIVTEVEDYGFGHNGGLIIEELNDLDDAEEETIDASEVSLSSDPEIEEPGPIYAPGVTSSIQLSFRNEPVMLEPEVSQNTTLKDLFRLARQEMKGISDVEELWFRFAGLDLEVGEDNHYTHEPTIGHLEALSKEGPLSIEIESRESFHSRFNNLMDAMGLDLDPSETSKKRFKASAR